MVRCPLGSDEENWLRLYGTIPAQPPELRGVGGHGRKSHTPTSSGSIFDLKENVSFTMKTGLLLNKVQGRLAHGTQGSAARSLITDPKPARQGPRSQPRPSPQHALFSVTSQFWRLSPAFLARLIPAAALPGHVSGDGAALEPQRHRSDSSPRPDAGGWPVSIQRECPQAPPLPLHSHSPGAWTACGPGRWPAPGGGDISSLCVLQAPFRLHTSRDLGVSASQRLVLPFR